MDDSDQQQPARWPLVLSLGVLSTLFALWWLLHAVGISLGLCGEDGELSAEDYKRACGENGDGQIADLQVWIGLATTAGTALLAVFAWRERAWIYVGGAALWLLGMGILLGSVRGIVGV